MVLVAMVTLTHSLKQQGVKCITMSNWFTPNGLIVPNEPVTLVKYKRPSRCFVLGVNLYQYLSVVELTDQAIKLTTSICALLLLSLSLKGPLQLELASINAQEERIFN